MFERLTLGLVLAGLAMSGTAAQTLKDAYKDIFRIGAAINPGHFNERDARGVEIVTTHFNSVTPENDMKWERIHPSLDTYNWGPADKYVEFGEKHKMFIVGHTLVWHSQVPRWVFQNAEGGDASREELMKRMRDHILTVVGRYKGRVHGWDVVNEALNEDGTLRQSPWLRILGEEYLVKAFEYAREADPNAELYYNDYSLENEAKRNGAVALVKKLLAAGAKVTAIGSQGHNKMTWPSVEQQDATLAAFAALGVKVAITELDVDVLPAVNRQQTADISATAAGGANPYVNGLPDDMQQALAKRYAELFAVYVKHRKTISRITFWGVTDGASWLNNFPVRGRTNYPLLFDRSGQPKPAFQAVIRAAGK